MDIEYEAKFHPVDKTEIRKKLQEAGAELTIPERKMRRAVADRRSNPWMQCDHLRIRDEGGLIRLSAKNNAEENGKLTDQQEIDVEIKDYDKAVQLLKSAGIVFNYYIESLRETWKLDGAEIYIDTWPGLEPRLEIESDSEEKVKTLADKLGFDWAEKIITPMPETYSKVYGMTIDEVLAKMSNLTFENNPFKKVGR